MFSVLEPIIPSYEANDRNLTSSANVIPQLLPVSGKIPTNQKNTKLPATPSKHCSDLWKMFWLEWQLPHYEPFLHSSSVFLGSCLRSMVCTVACIPLREFFIRERLIRSWCSHVHERTALWPILRKRNVEMNIWRWLSSSRTFGIIVLPLLAVFLNTSFTFPVYHQA